MNRLAKMRNWVKIKTFPKYHHLLLFRFALINMVGFALLGVAYNHGLIDLVIEADKTYLSVLITAVFLWGLSFCGYKVWQTSKELNKITSNKLDLSSYTLKRLAKLDKLRRGGRSILVSAIRLELTQRIAAVKHIAGSLVLLGLIGTVVGFIIALSGVDPDKAADVANITPMISMLISGMSTALYTTLVGAIFNVWLMTNYYILVSGTVKLVTKLFDLIGEG